MIPNDFSVWMFKGGSPNHQEKSLRIFGLNFLFGPFWCSGWLRHPFFCVLKCFFTHSSVRGTSPFLSFTNATYRDTLPVSPTGPSEEIMGSAVWSMGDLQEPMAYLFGLFFRQISGNIPTIHTAKNMVCLRTSICWIPEISR